MNNAAARIYVGDNFNNVTYGSHIAKDLEG